MRARNAEEIGHKWFLSVFAITALIAGAGLLFLELADDMREGDLDRFDTGVLAWIAHHRSPHLNYFFGAVTALGSWPVLAIMTVGVCIGTWLARRGRMALALAAAMTMAPVLSSVLKRMHGRPRPQVMPHLDAVASTSFPSGHTIGSVVFCTTLALLIAQHARGRAMAIFLACYSALVGALVAASRVYLGVHYPSDVAGGALVAIAWSLAVLLVDRRLRG